MANWIGHILCMNCFLQHFIEGEIKGRIKVTGRQGRRRNKLLYDLKGRAKGKGVPLQARRGPRGFQEVKVPSFRDNSTGWW